MNHIKSCAKMDQRPMGMVSSFQVLNLRSMYNMVSSIFFVNNYRQITSVEY